MRERTAAALVVGSLNTDLVVHVAAARAGRDGGRRALRLNPGGKGANQAVAAARAGADVVMVGAVGADEFGARLVDDLAAEGVDTAGVLRLPQVASGVAAIVVDERGESQIAVASGANHGLKADDVTGAVERLDLSRARCALFSFELEDEVVLAGAALAARAA